MRSKHFTGIKLVELRHISQEFAACYLHTDCAKYLQTFTDQSPKNTDLLLCAAFVRSNNANYFRILPHVFTLAASSGSALAAVRPRDFLHGCHSLPISIASLHRPITQFCSFADLAKSCLQVHKSKFGRSASVQIEVWKPARSTITQNPKCYHFIIQIIFPPLTPTTQYVPRRVAQP